MLARKQKEFIFNLRVLQFYSLENKFYKLNFRSERSHAAPHLSIPQLSRWEQRRHFIVQSWLEPWHLRPTFVLELWKKTKKQEADPKPTGYISIKCTTYLPVLYQCNTGLRNHMTTFVYLSQKEKKTTTKYEKWLNCDVSLCCDIPPVLT